MAVLCRSNPLVADVSGLLNEPHSLNGSPTRRSITTSSPGLPSSTELSLGIPAASQTEVDELLREAQPPAARLPH